MTLRYLIHDYFGVDLQVVWKTVHNDVPPLKAALENIIQKELARSSIRE